MFKMETLHDFSVEKGLVLNKLKFTRTSKIETKPVVFLVYYSMFNLSLLNENNSTYVSNNHITSSHGIATQQ